MRSSIGRLPSDSPFRLTARHFPSCIASTVTQVDPRRKCYVCANTVRRVKSRKDASVEHAVRPDRPRTSVNEQTIDAVRAIIEDDPHSTYEQIEYVLGISSPSIIHSIVHDYLKLRKVCTRWVPHHLTDDQKRWRIPFCRHSLNRFEEGQSCHVFNIITGDESWFYHYNPETKEQSKVWKSKTDPCPTKVHRKKSSGKRMVAVFFMKSGLIKTVPLEAGATLNAS
ncbi:unnamed protein product [Rotaria sp. Silwood1]|nr:unnamed protein product [Rotaria sp. Silwood1]